MGHYDEQREAADSLQREKNRDRYRAQLRRLCEEACADEDPYRVATILRHIERGPDLDNLVAALSRLMK